MGDLVRNRVQETVFKVAAQQVRVESQFVGYLTAGTVVVPVLARRGAGQIEGHPGTGAWYPANPMNDAKAFIHALQDPRLLVRGQSRKAKMPGLPIRNLTRAFVVFPASYQIRDRTWS